jgi:hypothetical protein
LGVALVGPDRLCIERPVTAKSRNSPTQTAFQFAVIHKRMTRVR